MFLQLVVLWLSKVQSLQFQHQELFSPRCARWANHQKIAYHNNHNRMHSRQYPGVLSPNQILAWPKIHIKLAYQIFTNMYIKIKYEICIELTLFSPEVMTTMAMPRLTRSIYEIKKPKNVSIPITYRLFFHNFQPITTSLGISNCFSSSL